MDGDEGFFIALEGTDGSGKTVQFELLYDRLVREGYDVATFSFPRYSEPSSYFIQEYLSGRYGSTDEVGPYTASLFYTLDRYQAAHEIRDALAAGKIVLCDRFAGSNMAHQGTKFIHAEERRGFFIWLDNLEFEMLGLPRPDMNLVLRVPAEVAHRLVEQREGDKPRDIHEANLEHLAKSVEVYDDLCRLFPKDFTRLDCVRSGELMEPAAINELLWRTIEPHLPLRPEHPGAPQPLIREVKSSSAKPNDNSTVVPYADTSLNLDASGLLSAVLAAEDLLIPFEQKNGSPRSFVAPKEFNANLTKKYKDTLTQILALHKKMRQAAGEAFASAEVDRAIHLCLPVAVTAPVSLNLSSPNLAQPIARLQSLALPEAQEAASRILNQVRKTNPQVLKHLKTPTDKSMVLAIKELADQHLTNHNSDPTPAVLMAVWPRNELDLLPDMLYEFSDASHAHIADDLNRWPIERKEKAFQAYAENYTADLPGKALEAARYTWEIISDFATFRELQDSVMLTGVEWQNLTPKYGYEVPKIIEESGISDQFETCFDLSLELYSALQAAGHEQAAQYATLAGHKLRFKVTLNANTALKLFALLDSATVSSTARELLKKLRGTLAETHPLLWPA